MSESPDPAKVLVVSAHPDDVDFGAAGSVAVWTDQRIEVAYCIVTDGSAGSADPGIAPGDLVQIRQEEQRKAATEVGVTDLYFLGYLDGSLQVSLELRRDIARIIRIVRPRPRDMPVPGAQLGPDPREPPGSPCSRRGSPSSRIPRREESLRPSGASR